MAASFSMASYFECFEDELLDFLDDFDDFDLAE
jgi:hypothetical protein